MKTKPSLLLVVFAIACLMGGCAAPSKDPNYDHTIKILGMTLMHSDGSWVDPNETKFDFKQPKTWVKRNYGRHYMQGSDELVHSLIEIDWPKFKETVKAGERVKLGEVIKVFRLRKTYRAAKAHPEAVIFPAGMAIGSVLEGSEGVVVFTIGLTETAITTSFKILRFVGGMIYKPIKPFIGGQ